MDRFDPAARGTLLEKTYALLKENKTPPHIMFAETGLPFFWIKDMRAHKSDDPSVNRVQYLYEYLQEKQLEV